MSGDSTSGAMVDYDRDDYDGHGWQDVYLITAAELRPREPRLSEWRNQPLDRLLRLILGSGGPADVSAVPAAVNPARQSMSPASPSENHRQ